MPIKDKEKRREAQKRADAKRAGRTRNFATIVYPESAPDDWMDKLTEMHVAALVSPLHDRDVNPSGEPKKPHYHLLLIFEGPKDYETQVKPIFEQLGAVGREMVLSARGYARYLCHLDNPEKAQYEPSDVRCIASDYIGTIGLAIDKYVALGEMQDFCEQYDVVSFYALAKYARGHRPDWHRILCDCGYVYMREYLQSRKWSKEQNYGDIIDPATGEVL